MSSTNGGREVLEAARKRLASAKSQRSVASKNLKMQQQMLNSAKSMSEAADKEYKEARKALENAEKKYEVIDIDNDNKGSRKPPAVNLPILTGTLAYSDRDNIRRHIIRGNWKFESSHAVPPQRFELLRTIPPEEDLKELPKDGEFNGSFNLRVSVKTSKGKIKLKSRSVSESGVKLSFKPKEDDDTIEKGGAAVFAVHGTGTNEYGVFELFGTATKNTDVEEGEDTTYSISVHKKYIAPPPAPPASATTKADSSGSEETEDSEVDDIHSLSCPITGMIFTNPVKNKICHHRYDRVGLSQLLGARKMSCPIPGCGNKKLSYTQVEDDEHMKVRVERYLIRKAAEKMKYRS